MKLSLKKLKNFHGPKGPVLLVIMDGIGIGPKDESNAVYLAETPNMDRLFASRLYTQIQAHGKAVGLPSDEDMGNSEVGHNALGAGRVFDQGARLVNRAIRTGSVFETRLWEKIMDRGRRGGTLHFIGLLSDGNVHSHIDQLFALVDHCADRDIKRVRLHALLDGRDVGERSALEYIMPTQGRLK
ncbi:MAG TPA: 2,3-bisphosphoglycerate-independent phosphoglycerate mutase, partial [Synergistetes bacterium]|nr:2,3-bisphosphoglycerate-independent phosphoglycerate mutase [Synergistota bacterium]